MSLEPFIAAFAATAVEFFETVVIAYALIRLGHWREAASAVLIGHVLVAMAAISLYGLAVPLPLDALRLFAALLLLSTGAYWTLKSFKRLRAQQRPRWVDDPIGKLGVDAVQLSRPVLSIGVFAVMLKTSIVEAAEIALFVLPVASADRTGLPAMLGCFAAIAAVLVLAGLAHRRLREVPEVRFKLGAGLVLTLLGLIWLIELALEH